MVTTTTPLYEAPIKAHSDKKVATPFRPYLSKKYSAETDDETSAPTKKASTNEAGKFGDNPVTFEPEDLTKYCHDPKNSPVNSKVTSRTCSYINLPDTREYKKPPQYEYFGGSTEISYSIAGSNNTTLYKICNDCDIDFFHKKYLFWEYCVEATKRWYCENNCSAPLREAYIVFKVHYIRRLGVYSHVQNGTMRSSKVKYTPRCICDGSLKHAITWCKCHMECHEYYCYLHGYKLIT